MDKEYWSKSILEDSDGKYGFVHQEKIFARDPPFMHPINSAGSSSNEQKLQEIVYPGIIWSSRKESWGCGSPEASASSECVYGVSWPFQDGVKTRPQRESSQGNVCSFARESDFEQSK